MDSSNVGPVRARTRRPHARLSFATWLKASAATLALFAMPGIAAAAFVPPPNVTAYRLAFLTEDRIQATSSLIETYNDFVTQQAGLNVDLPAVNWRAIGSVPGIDAIDNISCGAACDALPIYFVDGTLAVASSAALFDNSPGPTITKNQFGLVAEPFDVGGADDNYVWTGSNEDGTGDTNGRLGAAFVTYGFPNSDGRFDIDGDFRDANTQSYRLYAVSAEIRAATDVPEPATGAALLAAGMAVTGIYRRRRNAAAR